MLTKILHEELKKIRSQETKENGTENSQGNGSKREAKREETGEYKVGPGCPPKQHRFKPGNPGGPGRPRKLPTVQKLVRMMLEESSIADRQKQELVLALFRQAARGNVGAIRLI
ncbi:MAG TPA: DUF5681 domain-containing protein, partial [Fimbriimonadaceae bacterium]|nr:DUF5681 domain-containing protein [Fimbriimonadaceae bacterium]